MGMVILLFNNCGNEDLSKGQFIDDFDDLIQETKGASYKGSITSFTTASNEIGIKLTGQTNELFVLQRESNNDHLNIDISRGQIIYLYDVIILNSLEDNKKYLFSVNNEKADSLIKRIRKRINITSQISGYGLANVSIEDFDKYNFRYAKSIEYALIEGSLETKNPEKINKIIEEDCESGGEGSSSCSTSGPGGSCSVSCNDGYYACCNSTPKGCNCEVGG